jgi:hypothetical protein
MKAVIASLLACALPLAAQITATLNRLTDSSIEIAVRNRSAVAATAFAIKVSHGTKEDAALIAYLDPDVVYIDTAIDPAMRPLPSDQECTFKPRLRFRRGGPAALDQSGQAKSQLQAIDLSRHTITVAGVFADGSTTGDAGLLTRLMLRRSNMLLALETTLEILSDAGRRNVPQDQLIGQFKKLADPVRRGYLLPEQRVGLDLYQSMIGKLLNLPGPKDGSPFPPNEFVAREMAPLQQQRSMLLESQPSLFSFAGSSPNSR